MKLRNIYFVCRDNYNVIDNFEAKDKIIGGREGKEISGWNDVLNALMNTRKIKSLEKESDSVINAVPELFRTQDKFNVRPEEWRMIYSAKKTLLRTLDDTMDLYEKMGMDTENRNGIDIKLPSFNDFTEFVDYLNDLRFVFTKCPFIQSSDEKLQFDNVDVGSTWLTFFVAGGALAGGSILLNNIASFIDKCIILRSHYLTVKKQKQDFENENKSEEEKKIILGYINSLYGKEVDTAIQELERITDYKIENKDGDERGRIEQCFEKMRNLLDKGLQIYSAIEAPSETRRLFEPLEMKYLEISNEQKLLEKKEEK